MAIKLTNTLSGKKEEFIPLREGEVGIYLCGPTVYDEPHIGHARSAYVFDVIRNYFNFKGYKVRFVRNVTDVDDKIINKARELGRDLKEATSEVAERYYKVYNLWMGKLGLSPPDIEPWATDHIDQMQALIQKLIEKGYAYTSNGNVYFSVKKFKDYGKLSKRRWEDMIAGARIEPGEDKEDPLDFALWKKAKGDEPSWDSPWGAGRPGWHIECSAMSMAYLGESFDIHCGGLDLIFPHHENEIAQSEAATGKQFAKYWLHNGLLTIEGEKMAKSLGNFITVERVLEKFHPDALKIFFLSVHYRNPIDFSWRRLEEASKVKEGFDSFLSKVKDLRRKDYKGEGKEGLFRDYLGEVRDLKDAFIEAMDDDFNTALAFGKLCELLKLGNKILAEPNLLYTERVLLLSEVRDSILRYGRVFSLFGREGEPEEELSALIDSIIEIRDRLRKEKLYELSDKIRQDLKALGIILEDGKDRTVWRRVR